MQRSTFTVTNSELLTVFRQKYNKSSSTGWGPKLRLQHGYFTPDDHYEALVGKLLFEGAEWCDVGCGRNIFPDNAELAKRYAARCRFVFGVDPDDNVRENAFLHAYFQGLVEECPLERNFDVITLRMVAEHIADPAAALGRIAALLKPNAHALIYTPHKWAPMSLVANNTPYQLHNPLKRLLWNSEARDTFPTKYRLNTRSDITIAAHQANLELVHYERLDDCRITNSYRLLNRLELMTRSALSAFRIPYPEACLIAILRRPALSTG